MDKTTLVKRRLKNFAKANKVLVNENVTKMFESIAESGSITRKDLFNNLEVSESTFSGYLSSLESVNLVVLNKKGRCRYLRISPYGRKLSDTIGLPISPRVPRVTSDINRILMLKTVSKEDKGSTFTDVYYNLNRMLEKYRLSEITSALLSYHLRILKEETQITPESPYRLTSEGKLTLHAIEDIVGYQI